MARFSAKLKFGSATTSRGCENTVPGEEEHLNRKRYRVWASSAWLKLLPIVRRIRVAARDHPRGGDRNQAAGWSGGLAFDLLDLPGACARDGDAPRLHGLGNLALKLDDQQTILEVRALDFNVVSQGELALE